MFQPGSARTVHPGGDQRSRENLFDSTGSEHVGPASPADRAARTGLAGRREAASLAP
ncbi:hypothetical protein [Amycolatopsis alba]|uniref:hypothetical protein n=1 Tax=Amycolatopsis alba TaxID=76020 RepID=UPI0003655622